MTLKRALLATAILILAAGPAIAESEPPPPAGPSPQPVPYPGDPQPPPPQCTNRFCIPKPGATQGGVAEHKHIGQVKYSDFAKSSEVSTAEFSDSPGAAAQSVEVVGLSWGKLKDAGTVNSADPMEGGQVAGQSSVAQRTYRPGRPTFGNVTIEEAPVTVAEPVAKGTATFKTLAGLCATGKHLVKVKITTRTGGYTLHDTTVISVAPADPVDGRPMEQVTLSYASLGD